MSYGRLISAARGALLRVAAQLEGLPSLEVRRASWGPEGELQLLADTNDGAVQVTIRPAPTEATGNGVPLARLGPGGDYTREWLA